jgi:uncharacterized protein|tara:strand:- start:2963 stop:4372 length:1410 start_codon:yes stop_codon:yes gene_type:complete
MVVLERSGDVMSLRLGELHAADIGEAGGSPLQSSKNLKHEKSEMARGFNVMLKPRGPICNLDCKYCYYLEKEQIYPQTPFSMDIGILEKFVREYIETQPGPEVTFTWQGGEPTLVGLDYYRKAVELQHKYTRQGIRVTNALQTNGVLLDDEWCNFFRENDFLLGISVDGPAELHDAYRVDKGGRGTFLHVMRGLDCVKKNGVEYNILTTVHAANSKYPIAVYKFLRDDLDAKYIQFIPIVEKTNGTVNHERCEVSGRSVTAGDYGEFLIQVFEEWVSRDVGSVFVQIFDVALAVGAGMRPGLCVFEETCGSALAMEHNGDIYSCDHFVEPGYLIGNLSDGNLLDLVSSRRQRVFGLAKAEELPRFCRKCEVRFACHGGCPKNRFIKTPDGELGLNYLCDGYKRFFTNIQEPIQIMVSLLKRNLPPADIMNWKAKQRITRAESFRNTARNARCPCGSGQKFKKCCMRKNV